MTTIVTLRLDPQSQRRFDALRTMHYPAALNQIAAHLTLFHTLPAEAWIGDALELEAQTSRPFTMRVSGVRSLGRGVAYAIESHAAADLRARLAAKFREHLTPQDRQGFRPHVVVQNKVAPPSALNLLTSLQADFTPWEVTAEGLDWWDYLGGLWKLRELFAFRSDGWMSPPPPP